MSNLLNCHAPDADSRKAADPELVASERSEPQAQGFLIPRAVFANQRLADLDMATAVSGKNDPASKGRSAVVFTWLSHQPEGESLSAAHGACERSEAARTTTTSPTDQLLPQTRPRASLLLVPSRRATVHYAENIKVVRF